MSRLFEAHRAEKDLQQEHRRAVHDHPMWTVLGQTQDERTLDAAPTRLLAKPVVGRPELVGHFAEFIDVLDP